MNLATLVVLTLASPALAQTTWYVDDDGTGDGSGTVDDPFTSIQFAIAQDSTLDGDTVLVLPGTYLETVDFLGKTLILESSDGLGVTTIDAGGAGAVIIAAGGEGEGTLVQGFSITGGTASGVFCVGSTLEIRGCRIHDNQNDSGVGGGLYAEDATLSLFDTIVESNGIPPVFGAGGGLYAASSAIVLEEVTVRQHWPILADGGGLYIAGGSLDVVESMITDNYAAGGAGGGGLTVSGADVCIRDSEFSYNSTDPADHPVDSTIFGGGGLRAESGASVELSGVTFKSNSADEYSGGAIAVDGGAKVVAERCILFGNTVRGVAVLPDGGASAGNVEYRNCTLYGNSADGEGGGAFGGTLKNSIVWGNTPDNLAGDAVATYSCVGGGWEGEGNIGADPLFVDPSAEDFELSVGSPCIDAGCPDGPPDPDGTRADMGALPYDWQEIGDRYCQANPNSSGAAAAILMRGVPDLDANFARLDVSDVALNQFGYFLASAEPDFVPFFGGSQGNLCLGSHIVRVLWSTEQVLFSGSEGAVGLRLDWSDFDEPFGVEPGSMLHFQYWFRDVVGVEFTSNTSDAVSIILE